MARVGSRIATLIGFGLITVLLAGCSFIAEPPPGSANELRPGNRGRRCGRNFWYPVADTASVATGIIAVVTANQNLADAEPHDATMTTNDGSQYTVHYAGNGGNTDLYRAERAAGYGVIGLFGASAIYGYIVEARCAALRHESAPAPPPPLPARHGFPGNVLGFSFRMQQAQAAQWCASRGQRWSLEGAIGVCGAAPTAESPQVRVTFELGAASEIRTVYPGTSALNRDYAALLAGLQSSYGAPQVEPSPLSSGCSASLAQCLTAGERPTGPVWHWAGGTIELGAIQKPAGAVLEIRYTREEPQAQ